MATNYGSFSWPSSSSTSANASVGLTGTTAPTSATEIGGISGGNLVGISVDSSGNQNVNVVNVPAANPAGNSPGSSTVSTAATLTAPANAVGFILMCLDTSTANMRYRIGATATSSSGQQLQPGRDTGYIPCGANISICAESGTQAYDIQWILRA